MRLISVIGSLLSLAVCHVAASPTQHVVRQAEEALLLRDLSLDERATTSPLKGKNLRILPLGASITFGYHSTDGNGYRKRLRDMLAGANVTYIGGQCSGNMQNGNNEGHPGLVISDMLKYGVPKLALKPNVVLIYVGTNDMFYPVDPDNAPQRMADLVNGLYAKYPKALYLIGDLFLETDPVVQARINKFNAALPNALYPLYQKGVNIGIASMANALTKSDLFCDGEHPIDSGYQKMASAFAARLTRAATATRIPTLAAATGTDKKCTPLAPTPIGTCAPKKTSTTSTTTSTTTSSSSTSTTSTIPTITDAPSTTNTDTPTTTDIETTTITP